MAKLNKVCVNLAQDFTDAEKQQARDNIGAGTGNSDVVIKTTSMSFPPVDTTANTLQLFDNGRLRFDSRDVGVVAPYPSLADSGKILVSRWSGSPAIGSAVWESYSNISDFAFAEYGTTTFSEIQNMLNAGKQVLLTSNGRITGFYKYSTDDAHLFQYFYSDPVRFMEYWCTAPNTWTNYTYYATDLRSLPQYCYYREEIGKNGYQVSVSNPKWSIWPPSATWYDMAGTAKTGSTQNDLLKSYGFPRTCRYGASATVQLQTDAVLDPSVSIVCRLKLIYSYRTEGSTSYVEFDVPFWEGQLYTFTNFRDISYGTTVRSVSDPIQLNAIADLPQNYWKGLANSSTIYDYHFRYVLEAIHGIPSSVSTMWLERSGMRESLAIMY